MAKRLTAMKNLLLLSLIASTLVLPVLTPVSGQADVKLILAVYVAPDKLPADGGSYRSLIVQIEEGGEPTVAPSDIQVTLTSSNKNVGTVDPEITIPRGRTYTLTEFQTTSIAGVTTVTASAEGVRTGSAEVTTVTLSGTPVKLGLYVAPPSIPSEPSLASRVTIRLENSEGLPAEAPSKIDVYLTSSNPEVGSVDGHVTIPASETQATATFHATYTPGTTTITASSVGYASASETVTTVGTTPTRLSVFAFPANLHTGDQLGWIIVQLLDADGNLAKAPSDIRVTLHTDNPNVAYPTEPATIKAGESQAWAHLAVVATGTVTITAIADGYSSVSTTVTSYTNTGSPTQIVLSIAPGIPSDGYSHTSIVVQLLDGSDRPATLPSLTSVQFSSSNMEVGSAVSTTIQGGQSHALANFQTTHIPGATTITAYTSGYSPATAVVTTSGSLPSRIALFTSPSRIFADNTVYQLLVAQLQDSSGKPVRASGDVTVSLLSSNLEVGSVDSAVIIPEGSDHALANFHSTKISGTTTITSLAQLYSGGSVEVTTQAPGPSTLAVFAVPSRVVADGTSYDSIFIQLRDSKGTPAVASSDVNLYLRSSDSRVGTVNPVVTIPAGNVFAVTKFHSTTVSGETTVSVLSNGFASATLDVSTLLLATSVTVEANPERVTVGDESTVNVTALGVGAPLPLAEVLLQTNLGSFAATILSTDDNGHASTKYFSDQAGEAVVNVKVSKPGYQTFTGTLTITVTQRETPTPTPVGEVVTPPTPTSPETLRYEQLLQDYRTLNETYESLKKEHSILMQEVENLKSDLSWAQILEYVLICTTVLFLVTTILFAATRRRPSVYESESSA